MKIFKIILIIAIATLAAKYFDDPNFLDSTFDRTPSKHKTITNADLSSGGADESDDKIFSTLYKNHRSGVQVMGAGKVERILPTDNQGSRHQRFIVRLASGQTLLISHNIDLAPTITSLSVNENVTFYGQYEWNDEGGVVHWTHNDPNGQHVGGWIVHNKRTYR